MGTPGPQKISRYGIEFKLKAAQPSEQSGVLIKDVAELLCIHPLMLSKLRKQVRDGVLTGESPPPEPAVVAELQRLREEAACTAARPALGQYDYHAVVEEAHPLMRLCHDLERLLEAERRLERHVTYR